MPVSKHRKKKGAKKRKFADLNEAKLPIKMIRIRKHRFRELRNNPDFLAFVKIGRVVNAVTSSFQFISDYINDDSPIGRRQYNRAFFIASGFLHEGLEVAISIRLKYLSEPFFDNFSSLMSDEYKVHRKILKEIRHSVAFHLDSDDKSTKLALVNLNLNRYDLMSGNSDRMMDFCFDFADTVDFNYLIDKFKDNRSETEVLEEIIKFVTELMIAFVKAGHEFLVGLAKKMNFTDYVD